MEISQLHETYQNQTVLPSNFLNRSRLRCLSGKSTASHHCHFLNLQMKKIPDEQTNKHTDTTQKLQMRFICSATLSIRDRNKNRFQFLRFYSWTSSNMIVLNGISFESWEALMFSNILHTVSWSQRVNKHFPMFFMIVLLRSVMVRNYWFFEENWSKLQDVIGRSMISNSRNKKFLWSNDQQSSKKKGFLTEQTRELKGVSKLQIISSWINYKNTRTKMSETQKTLISPQKSRFPNSV